MSRNDRDNDDTFDLWATFGFDSDSAADEGDKAPAEGGADDDVPHFPSWDTVRLVPNEQRSEDASRSGDPEPAGDPGPASDPEPTNDREPEPEPVENHDSDTYADERTTGGDRSTQPVPRPSEDTMAAALAAASAPAPRAADADPDEAPAAPAKEQTGSRRLLSATAIMASGTIVSRILGLIRVILAAYLLGNNTRQSEMYAVATTVPNSLYILFAGGALNTVLVPQLVRAVKNDKDGGEAYTNRIMTAFLLLVGGLALVLALASPLVTWIYTSDAWRVPELAPQYGSMTLLTGLCLIQVFFYGAFFLFGQVLNARDDFGPMMWAPIANNVVQISVLSLYAAVWTFHSDTSGPFTLNQTLLLGLGSVFGIAVQTAVLIPFMRRVGFHYKPRFDLRHTGLGHTFHIAKWTLGFVIVNQIALTIVTRLGTSATAGGSGAGMTAYNNANLLWILPHSLITVSLATAVLPSISRLAASDDLSGVNTELGKAIKLATTATVPVSLLYFALGVPIAMLAFRGPTKGGDLVGWTLVAFALGLVPFTVQYLVLRGFYAFEDTRTTFWIQCVIAGSNAVLAYLFVGFIRPGPNWVAPALALSYTLAYGIGVWLSMTWYRKRVPEFSPREVLVHIGRLAAAALPGTLLAWIVVMAVKRVGSSILLDLVGLLVGGAIAVGVFLVLARTFKIAEVTEVLNLLLRRGRAKQATSATSAGAFPEIEEDEEEPEEAMTTPPVAPVSAARDEEATAVIPAEPPVGDPEETSPNVLGHDEEPATVATGDTLGARYRLEEKLAVRGSTQTWRAVDQVLSRSVLVHILAAGYPRTPEILDAARQSARATDSRFLRVLDAVQSDEEEIGSYIVCEWAEGVNLERLLAAGPLTALESAWLVRDLADALAGMHAQGMYHQRLNPDTVVVTAAGNVKIVGFGIEAALYPREAAAPAGRAGQEALDVIALGKLLYCTLVSRWPGGPGFGMPAAPVSDEGAWQPPSTVRPGVSPALDRITTQILNPDADDRLRTATAIVAELSRVLGAADPSADLERRVRHPATYASGMMPPVPTASETVPAEPEADAEATRVTALPPTPVPPPPEPVDERRRSRVPAGLIVLVAVVVLALIIGLASALAGRRAATAGSERPAATSTAGGASGSPTRSGPYTITGARDFDPTADGGNDTENPDQLRLAYDGNPDTSWTTLRYLGSPNLGRLKPGVGIVLDLGEAVPVSKVDLTLVGQPTTVEIRVPTGDAATAATPPMTSQNQWRVVGTAADSPATASVSLSQPVTTRYVLVYLTSLPQVSGGYRGGIAEVVVS